MHIAPKIPLLYSYIASLIIAMSLALICINETSQRWQQKFLVDKYGNDASVFFFITIIAMIIIIYLILIFMKSISRLE